MTEMHYKGARQGAPRPYRRALKLGAAALAFSAAAIAATAVAGPMIHIAGDPIRTDTGLVAGTRLASGVHAYLGIPYAKPPVLNLRWAPPQPMQWKGVWNADHLTPECIQVLRRHDINHYFGEEASGEDCLYLNVWTPPTAKPGAKLPVVVFIFGGGGTIGSAGMAHYDGENVAKHGAIFVNMNYRVGILGFMAHPELTKEQGGHSGNYGYMDQTAALKWVHDNIAAFGGDPTKVTLAGQSFGSSSVAIQMTTPMAKGLFTRAMYSSGCNLSREGVSLADGEKIGLEVQKRLGVNSLAALRNLPADKFVPLQAENENMNNVPGVTTPQVQDGWYIPGTKAQLLASHAGNDVPIIANSNGDDNDALRYPLTRAHTVAEYQAIAKQMYGADVDTFLGLYPVSSDADVQPMAHKAAIESGFMAGERGCGELQARYGHSPVYIDLFTRRHSYIPGVKIADQDTATVGAYHNSDIPFWFGTLEAFNKVRPTRAWTADDWALSDKMMASLIAFTRTGKPETADIKWPAWSEANPQYLVLDYKPEVRKMDLKRMDWMAAHPPAPVVDTGPSALHAHD
ncbi:MAG TPA: carboxylesterase family protein [Caulobacteraceae bacterium]|nr:carboxylesterase family protein [Caulobacteraceae bacterium]